MKNKLTIYILLFMGCFSYAQIDGTLLLGLTHATTSEMTSIVNPVEGSLIYNKTEKSVFQYNGNTWTIAAKLPLDIADGDDDTTYTAGTGLLLDGTKLSVDNESIKPDWSNIQNMPENLDDDNFNEIQTIKKTGSKITLSQGGGSINETETTLKQDTDTGKILYTNELGDTQKLNLVSEDKNNSIKIGADGGVYYDKTSKITSTTIKVDQSNIWAGQVNDNDIHSNGVLTIKQARSDDGWKLSGQSTLAYTGSPDYVEIDLMSVANNTGNHWAHPHIKVFRNGKEIGEGSGLYMDDSGTYSGRTTIVISMVDPTPGKNPVYTFTTLEDDNRTMNNPTIVDLSPVSLVAVNKLEVVLSVSSK